MFSFMAAYVVVTFFQLGGMVYIAVLTVLIAALFILNFRAQNAKMQAMAAARTDATLCNFARSFDLYQIDPWIIRAVFEEVQRTVSDPGIQIRPRANDDLMQDLHLDPDDFEDEIWDKCATRAGRQIDATDNPRFGKIITVRDVVLALQNQPFSKDTIHGT